MAAKLKEIRIHRIYSAAKHGGIDSTHCFCQCRHVRPLRSRGLHGWFCNVIGCIFRPGSLCSWIFSARLCLIRRLLQRKAGTPVPIGRCRKHRMKPIAQDLCPLFGQPFGIIQKAEAQVYAGNNRNSQSVGYFFKAAHVAQLYPAIVKARVHRIIFKNHQVVE